MTSNMRRGGGGHYHISAMCVLPGSWPEQPIIIVLQLGSLEAQSNVMILHALLPGVDIYDNRFLALSNRLS
jgi:hypothetical protein